MERHPTRRKKRSAATPRAGSKNATAQTRWDSRVTTVWFKGEPMPAWNLPPGFAELIGDDLNKLRVAGRLGSAAGAKLHPKLRALAHRLASEGKLTFDEIAKTRPEVAEYLKVPGHRGRFRNQERLKLMESLHAEGLSDWQIGAVVYPGDPAKVAYDKVRSLVRYYKLR